MIPDLLSSFLVRIAYLIEYAAEFSMLHSLSGLTGGSDDGRCLFRVGCRLEWFLLPRFHTCNRKSRSSNVIAGQWELAVLMFANWAAVRRGAVRFWHGEALVPCPVCKRDIHLSSEVVKGSGILHCRDAGCWGADRVVPVLQAISSSGCAEAFSACRRIAGGVRSYPLFRGLKVQLQAPVLHCTGYIAKHLVHFILACLPEDIETRSKQVITAITSKGKVDSLYLREFRELVAAAVACPDIFTRDLDPVFYVMLQLVQLINASLRASLTDPTDVDRSGAAAVTRLAASVLGPLYMNVKPLDPGTKNAKVTTIYLHAALAHVHEQVGPNRPRAAYVSDDNMEGHVRAVGRHVYNNANNASQSAIFSDFAALRGAALGFTTSRSHPSSLVYTKHVHVCKCWTSLSVGGDEDFAVIRLVVEKSPELSLDERSGADALFITFPLHGRVEDNGMRRRNDDGTPRQGKKEALRRGLRVRLRAVRACFCGKLCGGKHSRIVQFLLSKRAHSATAAAVAARVTAAAAASIATAAFAACRGAPSVAVRTASDNATSAAEVASAAEEAARAAAIAADLPAPVFSGPVTTAGRAPSPVVFPDAFDGRSCAGDTADTVATVQGSSGGGASSAAGSQAMTSHPTESAQVRRPAPRRSPMMTEMLQHVPPHWALAMVLPRGAAASGLHGGVQEPPPAPESVQDRDAVLRQQATVLRLLLMRASKYEFVSWTVGSGVPRDDFVTAARTVLSRIEVVRKALVWDPATTRPVRSSKS